MGCLWGSSNCRIHQHPPSQGRACIRRDAIAIQSRDIALDVASWTFTMVGFQGDFWRRDEQSGLRLVVGAGLAPGTPTRAVCQFEEEQR